MQDFLFVEYDGQRTDVIVGDKRVAKPLTQKTPKIKLDLVTPREPRDFKPHDSNCLNQAITKSRRINQDSVRPGHAKFDLYCNVLPQPIRELLCQETSQLCARTVYQEYRTLKKAGLVAKYCQS